MNNSSTLKGHACFLLLAAVLIVCTYLVFGGPIYESNDDAGMSLIASGLGYSSTPNEHILFSHFLIGIVLSKLFSIIPDFPWYGVYVITAHVAALSIILNYGRSPESKTPQSLWLPLLLYLTCCMRPIEFMQFTTTAGLLAIAAGLVWLKALRVQGKTWNNWLAFSLLVSAAMIRVQSAQLVSILFFMYSLATFGMQKEKKKLISSVLVFAVAISATLFIDLSNKAYYQKDAWSDWYALNGLQARAIEFGRNSAADARTVQLCSSVGWSKIDLDMLRNWYLLDASTYSRARLEKFCLLKQSMLPGITPAEATESLKDVLFDKTLILASMALLIALALSKERKAALLYLAGSTAMCIFLLVFWKLPIHVYSLIVPCSALLILNSSTFCTFSGLKNRYAKITLAIIAAILVGVSYTTMRQRVHKVHQANRNFQNAIRQLKPQKHQLYMVWGAAMPIENLLPFVDPHPYFKDFNLCPISAQGRSPMVMERLEEWSIQPTLCNMDKDNVFLVGFGHDYVFDQYVSEKCGKKLLWTAVFTDIKAGLQIFKLQSSSL